MPSLLTTRISPVRSVTRISPPGKNAIDHGLFSRVTTVSTFSAGESFCGAGAPVWPGNAGLGAG
jgi:hypothetical protein